MVIAAAVLLATGCASSSTGPTENSSATLEAPTRVSRISWKPLLTLAELGRFETRCDRNRFAVSFTAKLATETVALWIDGASARSRVLQPDDTWATRLRGTKFQIWRVAQATEPQTIKAIVRVAPSRCPYGVPTTKVDYATASFNSR
jgi:hypothetical protein